MAELESTFVSEPLEHWRTQLADFTGVWAPALTPAEVHGHVQVDANGYLPEVVAHDGSTFRLPAPPMQFGGVPPVPGRSRSRARVSTPRKSCSNWGTIGTPSPSCASPARSGE